ncbi:MAG: type 4a pilus biogenesis protein PilO [Actinomycetota bacterium]
MTSRRQLAVVAGVAVLVTLAFFVLLLNPKLGQISAARDDTVTAEQEEAQLRLDLKRLQGVRERAPTVIAQLAKVSQFLPSTPDLPGFIRLLQQAATESGVDLQSIAPSPPQTLENATGIQRISVMVVVEGAFRRIEDYMARVENLSRVVTVDALSLNPAQSELSRTIVLQGSLTMQMYVVSPTARLGAAAPVAAPSQGTQK